MLENLKCPNFWFPDAHVWNFHYHTTLQGRHQGITVWLQDCLYVLSIVDYLINWILKEWRIFENLRIKDHATFKFYPNWPPNVKMTPSNLQNPPKVNISGGIFSPFRESKQNTFFQMIPGGSLEYLVRLRLKSFVIFCDIFGWEYW